MSGKAIRWPFWTGAGLLVVLLVFFCYRDNRNYSCDGCHSKLKKNQARMGMWPVFSFPLFPVSAEERPSHLYLDYLASGHTHEWVFVQGSPYGLFGWGGCAVGGRKSTGNLAFLYEEMPNFRTFVRKKQAAGTLNPRDFVAACLLEEPVQYSSDPSLYPDKGHLSREAAIEKEAPEVQRLRRVATALQKEFSPP